MQLPDNRLLCVRIVAHWSDLLYIYNNKTFKLTNHMVQSNVTSKHIILDDIRQIICNDLLKFIRSKPILLTEAYIQHDYAVLLKINNMKTKSYYRIMIYDNYIELAESSNGGLFMHVDLSDYNPDVFAILCS